MQFSKLYAFPVGANGDALLADYLEDPSAAPPGMKPRFNTPEHLLPAGWGVCAPSLLQTDTRLSSELQCPVFTMGKRVKPASRPLQAFRAWGESSPRPVEYGALVLAHDVLSGGLWCAFLGSVLVRGVWCADFGVDFGAGVVRRFWGRFWCAVCGAPILGPILVHGALVRGAWCADFGVDFGARCVVRRFWCRRGAPILGPILVHGAHLFGFDFGARCVVRRFWGRFWCTVLWCAVCGVPILGSILVHAWRADFGADFGARCAFLGSILVRGAPFLGSILVRGVWCADFGADFGARVARRFWGRFWCTVRLFGFDFGAWCADVGVDFGARRAFLNSI